MVITVVDGGGTDYRSVVQRIDLRDYLASGKKRNGDKPVLVPCFLHDEKKGSLAVYRDGAYCHGCHGRVSVLEWVAIQEGLDIEAEFPKVVQVAAEKYASGSVVPRKIEKREIAAVWGPMEPDLALVYHSQLGAKREWFKKRGLSDEVIDQAKLGYTGRSFSIPVWDAEGRLQTIRYRRDDALTTEGAKYWGTKGRNSVYLFNAGALTFESLKAHDFAAVVTEGELDALRMVQEGYAAVSATNGAAALDESFLPMFKLAKLVYLVLDQDDVGRQNAVRLAKLLKSKARIVQWDPCEGKDVTEYLKTHSSEGLAVVMSTAKARSVRYWGGKLRGGYWRDGDGSQGC